MEYLVVLEVSQKQKYIFETNRLAENIGASIIIRNISESLPRSILKELNISEDLVLSGGGKSVYAFFKESDALAFTKAVSGTILKEYPGIELFMTTCGYDDHASSIIDAINTLYGKLEEKKSSRASVFRLYDLGITQQCESTGLPAVTRDASKGTLLSAESALKVKTARARQNESFAELLPESGSYRFANEFAELGVKEDAKSYIAVVAMDGNKMGRKIEKFRENFLQLYHQVNKENNERYKAEIRRLSQWIDASYKQAVKYTIEKLSKNSGKVLPIRPLILAGDDICFVADAKLGIALAKDILLNIEAIDTGVFPALKGERMCACAGVALVKEKYPFFRAHELAEQLCSNAKAILADDEDESVIDFHIVQGEIEGTISEIRRDKYNKGKLTSKPYYVHQHGTVHNTMDVFEKHMERFMKKDIGRGTIKEFRDALRQGEAATKQYIIYKRLSKVIKAEECYQEQRCIDFDVIELMDMYQQLEEI